jgi:hypothetical protein
MQTEVSLPVHCSQLHIQHIQLPFSAVTTIHILRMQHTVETIGMRSMNFLLQEKSGVISFCIESNSS